MHCLLTDRNICRVESLGTEQALNLPAEPGTYILLLRCTPEQSIRIGRLGTLTTRKGWYLNIGSAFGPGGIRARVCHHMKPSQHPRWHLDYLRPAIVHTGICYSTAPQRHEHRWAARLLQWRGVEIPPRGFGSWDCRCDAHLVLCRKLPQLTAGT